MSNKDIIKYFYEVVVSENLLDELHKYISEDCVQRVGEKVSIPAFFEPAVRTLRATLPVLRARIPVVENHHSGLWES